MAYLISQIPRHKFLLHISGLDKHCLSALRVGSPVSDDDAWLHLLKLGSWFSVICCLFVCLNYLVFRVRFPVVQKGTYKILSCSILTCVHVCVRACMFVF